MLYLLVFSIIYSLLRANFNCLIIKGDNWHGGQGLFVFGTVLGFFLMYYIQAVDMDFFKTSIVDIKTGWIQMVFSMGVLCFYFLTIHWIVFDISLNLMRQLKWDYYNPNGDSEMDKFLKENQFKVKGIFLIICGVLFIYYYHRDVFEIIGNWFFESWYKTTDFLLS